MTRKMIRELNATGMDEFRQYLLSLKTVDPKLKPPVHLLEDIRYTTRPEGGGQVEARSFESKGQFALYVRDAMKDVPDPLRPAQSPPVAQQVWATVCQLHTHSRAFRR